MPKILGMTQSAFDPASRFRWVQFLPRLRAAGWAVDHRPNSPDRQWYSRLAWRPLRGLHYRAGRILMKINRWRDVRGAGAYDAVFVNRDLAGGGLWYESRLMRNNPRVVFDFDDAIFVGKNREAVAWMCANSAWVTPGNKYLEDFAREYTSRTTIIPTVIDTDVYGQGKPSSARAGQLVRVGWSGSDQSIRTTLMPRLPMLLDIQKRIPFELVIIANSRPKLDVEGLRWNFVPWREEDESSLATFFDVGIMPLLDDEFQRGKCGLKLLQYMASGIPAIASPVGVNREIVEHEVSGYLASTESEWAQALGTLVGSAERRATVGQAGRSRCVTGYSVNKWLPVLMDILERVGRGARP